MTTQLTEGVSIDTDADVVLERLYDAHYVRLVRLAVLLLGDAGRAEEVVQDSFVAVYRRMDRLGRCDLPAYLRQTVVNRSRSVLRHLTVVAKHSPDLRSTSRVPTTTCSAGSSPRRHRRDGPAASATA